MTEHEQEKILQLLVATAEIMGTELKPGAVMMMVSDLAEYEFKAVANALTRCRKELSGKLTLKAILDVLAPAGGWLTANEAWAKALLALDEANTMVWDVETRRAWFIAEELMKSGDKVGARMAFIAAYEREVNAAKSEGRRPQIEVSRGDREDLYLMALSDAQKAGLLPPPASQPALPPPTPEEQKQMASNRERIAQGLKELSASFAIAAQQQAMDRREEHVERMRAANQFFEEQQAAALNAIKQDDQQ